MKFNILILFCALLPVATFSQDFLALNPERKPVHEKDISQLTELEIIEDSLVYLADSMYNSQLAEFRIDGSYEFIRMFKNAMRKKETFSYPFKKLSDKITIIQAPDNSFRLYNWEVLRGGFERRYYAVVQTPDGNYTPLVDVSDQIVRGVEDSVFSNSRWYGALYYNILQRNVGGQNIYFLFGWNGNSLNSEKKFMEALGFNSQGKPVFGAPVFTVLERGKQKQVMRAVLEYQRGAKIGFNYDKETDQVIFDHCESQIGDPAKKYTYIPDGTYDGMKWDGQQWIMYENAVQIQILEQGNVPLNKPIK